MRRWWLDEMAHAGEEHLDPQYVAGYDQKSAFDPAEDLDALKALGASPSTKFVLPLELTGVLRGLAGYANQAFDGAGDTPS